MPSRKQRRRRAKLKRHEYEYVVETEEGEVPVERLREAEESRAGKRNGSGADDAPVDRRGRPIEKPTLRRVLRRAGIFVPLLFLFVWLTGGDDLGIAGVAFQTLVLVAFFIPFSYVVDSMVYRMMLRRRERERAARRAR
jgi:hypothetical protein